MSTIFITGSADGLGFLAGKELLASGRRVIFHARNNARSQELKRKLPAATPVLIADLRKPAELLHLVQEVNAMGRMDTVIHNAGVYQALSSEITEVNVLAPYVLTCLIQPPERLIYLSSAMHMHGHFNEEKLLKKSLSYSDSKLLVTMLGFAIAGKWKEVYSNVVNPGWVPTKMGGASAPDDLKKGFATQVWLSVSRDKEALQSGKYFYHQKLRPSHPDANNTVMQEALLKICEEMTGVKLPA